MDKVWCVCVGLHLSTVRSSCLCVCQLSQPEQHRSTASDGKLGEGLGTRLGVNSSPHVSLAHVSIKHYHCSTMILAHVPTMCSVTTVCVVSKLFHGSVIHSKPILFGSHAKCLAGLHSSQKSYKHFPPQDPIQMADPLCSPDLRLSS